MNVKSIQVLNITPLKKKKKKGKGVMKNKELDEIINSMTEYNQNALNIRRTMIRSAFIG